MHEPTTHIVKLGSKSFAVVVEYCHHGGSGCRQGYWCDDKKGGWGTSSVSPEGAVAACGKPKTYRTAREAREAAALVLLAAG